MEKEVFAKGFTVEGRHILPLAYLNRVDLPDFGCEGRPDHGPLFGAVWGERADGKHFWRVEERKILEAGLRDDVWLGTAGGSTVLVPADRSRAVAVNPGLVDVILHTDGAV